MNSNNKEVTKTIIKSMFGLIPNIGTTLDQIVFEHRSRVKQNRINHFTQAFKEYLETMNVEDIEIEYINSEEFGDVFESIILRIANNRSKEKLEHFKHILGKQIQGENYSDFTETFLDIITRLNEAQIVILKKLNESKRILEPLFDEHKKSKERVAELKKKVDSLIEQAKESRIEESISKYKHKLAKAELKQKNINDEIRSLDFVRSPKTYALSEGDYMFFIQDLISKSLLVDDGIGKFDYQPYKSVIISEFGIKFLNFIEK